MILAGIVRLLLRRTSQKYWGLDFDEALEMSYENIKQEAASAIKGMRRPKNIKSESI